MTWEVDENGDGAIDWEEFQLMCAAQRSQPRVKCTSQARAKRDTSRHFSAILTTQPGYTHVAPTLHAATPAALA